MPATIAVMLAKSIGPMLAEHVIQRLLKSKGAKSKMERAVEATEKGMSVIAALRTEFGDTLLNAITSGVGDKDHAWTYEAGGSNYLMLDSTASEHGSLVMLRDELNINLDRLVLIAEVPESALLNYFRGTISAWTRRYTELIGTVEGEKEVFAAMNDLLDGRKRTFREALETISRTSLRGVGALLVLSGVLLATGTGVGLATTISIFLFGIPWVSVGALVIPGAILIGLSRYAFGTKHAMSTCVQMAYKLIEKRSKILVPEAVM